MDKEVFEREIATRIARLRKTKGVKQEDLAKHINLSRASVANIENGNQAVSAYTAMQIASFFGVNIQELIPTIERVEFTNIVGLSFDTDKKDILKKVSIIEDFVRSL